MMTQMIPNQLPLQYQPRQATIKWKPFSKKWKDYIHKGFKSKMSVAEGSVRSGKTIANCIIACDFLERCPDKLHLVTGSTIANAKLNIGDSNGYGLEHLFRGRCRWGKYKDNEALYINTLTGEKILIFAGGGKADSYKKILGNSYGLWIATEINLHFDSDDSRVSFIKTAMGRQLASIESKILWDFNPCAPTHPIYSNYVDKYKIINYLGGYNYQHFTLMDNLSITPERLEEIMQTYEVGSLWYRRDILGERCIAQGLCYEYFANNTKEFIVKDDYKKNEIIKITVGVDFGGSLSATTFVASGITKNYEEVVILYAKRITRELNPIALESEYIQFCHEVYDGYKLFFITRCDSAEQILIRGLRTAQIANALTTTILNAIKSSIINRIRFFNRLISSKRVKICERCKDVMVDALSNASWDPNKPDERLDIVGFKNPVDLLDAMEYSLEEDMRMLIEVG